MTIKTAAAGAALALAAGQGNAKRTALCIVGHVGDTGSRRPLAGN